MNLVIHKFSCEYRLEMGGDGANSCTTGDRRKYLLPQQSLPFPCFLHFITLKHSYCLYLLSLSVTLAHLLSQDSTLDFFFFFFYLPKDADRSHFRIYACTRPIPTSFSKCNLKEVSAIPQRCKYLAC